MNRPIRKVVVFCALLFAALLVNATVVQVGEAGSLSRNPHNGRVLIDSYERQRGDIVVDGVPIAQSVATSDALKYLRTYPGGSLYADVTGYYSLLGGSTGIERSEDGILAGTDPSISFSFSRIQQLLSGATPSGGNVTLTLDAKAQALAAQLLGDRQGAVVAMDPRTGAILAMVTSPSFDPDPLTVHDTSKAQAAYDALAANPNQPLLNRATQFTSPPGSTFKLIDTAAALSSGKYTPQTMVSSPNVLVLPGTAGATLSNYQGESCGGSQITLTQALEVSCNTAYANVGLDLGADALQAQAQAFGFGRTVDGLGVSQSASVFPSGINQPQTAQSAIGQFDVAATPLQMCMVAAAIGNGGVEMAPYLVASTSLKLKTLSTTQPQVFATPISATVASEMTQMMETVVQSGTGTKAQIPGIAVAGKTGTADHGGAGSKPNSWFVSFAPAQAPKVAMAVLVQDGGGEDSTGGAVAAPIAQQVMSLLLQEGL